MTTVRCYYFEMLFEKAILAEKDEELSDWLNQDNRNTVDFLVERRLNDLKKGKAIEFFERGCFIYDSPYEMISHRNLDNRLTLFAIPDGQIETATKDSKTVRRTSPMEMRRMLRS